MGDVLNTASKIGLAVVGVAWATALLLPDRQTVPVVGAFFNGFRGLLGTAMTGKA